MMKKYFKFTVCGSLLALFACQSNEISDVNAPIEGVQKISIRIADARSRAGRELLSSEASQSVENVMIVLTDESNAVVWTHQIANWNSSDENITVSSSDYGYGRESEIEIPKDECRLLGGSKYHAYALGYSENSDYDLSQFTSLKKGDSYAGNAKISISGKVMGEEIFAGDKEIIGNVGGLRAEVVLNRQVSGSYGYFTAVPYVRDYMGHVGSYLILTMDNPQSAFALGTFDNNNAETEYNGKYVVNGCQNSDSHVVYTINLSDWFVSIQPDRDADGRPSGLIQSGDNWKGDATCYQVGSVFGGSFILPTAKTDNLTLKLHLCYDNDVTTSMRSWNVTLPANAPQLAEYTLWQYGAEGWTSSAVTDTASKYSVLRNHLYAIGVKQGAALPSDPGDPNDPDNPGNYEDKPEPINNKQELTVTVNHNWQNIYILEID